MFHTTKQVFSKELRHRYISLIFPYYNFAAIPTMQPIEFPVDTSLAEKYIRKATTVPSDSLAYYYEAALNIYTEAKQETADSIVWSRYFEVSNLWLRAIKDRQFALQKFPQFKAEAVRKFGESSKALGENCYHFARRLAAGKQYKAANTAYQEALTIFKMTRDSAAIVNV